jgi:hypothetical protein
MNKFIATLMLCAFASVAPAEEVVIRVDGNLTDQQKAELQLAAAKAASTPGEVSVANVEAVREWVDIGTAIGSGLAASAKELGVAVNDFATSPVGIFTMVLIAWHYVGGELVSIVFGFVWLAFTIPMWLWMYRRQFFDVTITTYEKDKGPDGKRRVKTMSPNRAATENEGVHFLYWVTLIAAALIGALSILF